MHQFLTQDERFLGLEDRLASPETAGVIIVSVPFEQTSSYGTGSSAGPAAILDASHQVEFFDCDLGFEPCEAAGGIAWDGRHFWVPGARIYKFDVEGHVVGWIYPASEGTWDLAWDGRYLWACQRTNENWWDAKLFALDVLEIKPAGYDWLSGAHCRAER